MSDLPTTSRAWLLTNKPTTLPTLSGDKPTFTLQSLDLPSLQENQILVKTLFISNDPAQRGWIEASIPKEKLYVPPVETGHPMRARGLGEVLASTSDSIQVGDIVRGNINWRDYAVMDAATAQVVQPLAGGLNVSHYLGALGNTGLTAYYGLVVISEAKPGDRIVVSGAAGATGSMVVQIAKKIVGAGNVIGIAGSDDKCRWVEELGADKCLNYKSPSFKDDLAQATKDGVDIYYDNVGGEILDLMFSHMSRNGRIAACGAITGYNSKEPDVVRNWFHVISMRLSIRGFIILDYAPEEARKTQELLRRAIEDGTLRVSEESQTVVETRMEDVPKTWLRLFEGQNTGKLVTKLV